MAGAAFLARALGVVQRIPLQRLLDDAGMATYVTSYNVYMWLLMLATAGFPSAIAKLVSEKYAVGLPEEGEAIRRAALRYAWVAGIAAFALVYFLAPVISRINGDPDAELAIRALAPALLLFPWIAVERGYFHGRQRMGANGLSQIWEQILRVVTSVLLAYMLLELGYGLVWAAAGASFGGVLGAVAAAAVMLYYGVKLRKEDAAPQRVAAPAGGGDGGDGAVVRGGAIAGGGAVAGGSGVVPDGGAVGVVPAAGATGNGSADVSSFGAIFRAILKLSIPVSITALAVPTVYLIDSLVTIPLLRGELGPELAKNMLGLLQGRAQAIAGIPVIFAIALSQSILPIISSAFVRGEGPEVERQTSLALRMALISGLPAVVVLAAAAYPLNTFVFGDADGTWIIIALVCSVLFQIVMMISGSILLGLGRPELPMKHIGVGVGAKLVLSFALAPFLGIYGIVAATAICFAVTMTLNLRSLRGMVNYEVMGRRSLPFLITVLGQTVVGAAVSWAVYSYVHPFGSPLWDALLQTALAAAVAVAVYPALLLRTGAITPDDIGGMPNAVRKLWTRAEPFLQKLRILPGNKL